MKNLSYTIYDADQKTPFRIYKSLIRFKLNDGAVKRKSVKRTIKYLCYGW